MTDTLPSWATEKAREIANALWLDTFEKAALAEDITTALISAYQQGKQDGQREMHRRAQSAEGLLSKAIGVADDHIASLTNVAKKLGHWPAGSHWAKRAMEQWREAAIRNLDEVQDA